MILSYYIVHYTLINIFHGRKAAYAAALNIDTSNFRRMIREMTPEKGNARLMEATVEKYMMYHWDYSKMMDSYREAITRKGGLRLPCSREFFLERAKNTFEWLTGANLLFEQHEPITAHLGMLIADVEGMYCGKNPIGFILCSHYDEGDHSYDEGDDMIATPCRMLNALTQSLYIASKRAAHCEPPDLFI